MNDRQRIKKVSTASKNTKETIESSAYGLSTIAAIIMLSWGGIDLAMDGTLDILYTHPKTFAIGLLAPFVTGYLITKFDPNSETANDIQTLIEDIKPKRKVLKK